MTTDWRYLTWAQACIIDRYFTFQKESVDLILNLLDGSEHRGHKVKVERAQFTMKGNFDPTKKKKKLSNREKNKLKEKQAK